MFHLIAKTKMTGKEHGAKLCEKNNKIILSNSCIGSNYCVFNSNLVLADFDKSDAATNVSIIFSTRSHSSFDDIIYCLPPAIWSYQSILTLFQV